MVTTRVIACSSFLMLTTTSACGRHFDSSAIKIDSDTPCHSITSKCSLDESQPVVATRDRQVIEGLRIKATGRPAITVRNLSNVTIRNVEIIHQGSHGILCEDAPGLIIENVSITNVASDMRSSEENNIDCSRSDDLVIKNARLRGGSSGVFVLESSRPSLRFIEGHDFRGPEPRGQVVQFDKSPSCTLQDFSAINHPSSSSTEDNVSIYYSDNCIVRRGLLQGNNGPWSVAVMFENSGNGLVEDVDTVAQGNGSFSAYPGHDVTFRRTRARDNICSDQGRGPPVSDGLVWAGSPDSRGLTIERSAYFNLCNPDAVVWDRASFNLIDIVEEDFVPRHAIELVFAWEMDGEK
jgi:hypothetical protein